MYVLASRRRMASEIASEVKYTFAEIFEYILHGQYPVEADKSYKHGLRKRSKFFALEAGRLVEIGKEESRESSVVFMMI